MSKAQSRAKQNGDDAPVKKPSKNSYAQSILESQRLNAERLPTIDFFYQHKVSMPRHQQKMVSMEKNDESHLVKFGLYESAAGRRNFKYSLVCKKKVDIQKNEMISWTSFSHVSHPTYGGISAIVAGGFPKVVSTQLLEPLAMTDTEAPAQSKDLEALLQLQIEMHFTGGHPIYCLSSGRAVPNGFGIFDYDIAESNKMFAGCYANDAEFAEPILNLLKDFFSRVTAVAEKKSLTDAEVEKKTLSEGEVEKKFVGLDDFINLAVDYRRIVHPHANVILYPCPQYPTPVIVATKNIAKGESIIRETGIDVWMARCVPKTEILLLTELRRIQSFPEFQRRVLEKYDSLSTAESSSTAQ